MSIRKMIKILDNIETLRTLFSNSSRMERLIANEILPSSHLNGIDQHVLNLAIQEHPSQAELDQLLKVWDIEKKDQRKSLLLAYTQKNHPDLNFGEYSSARLNGLLLNYRFKNTHTIAMVSGIVKCLNSIGIVPLAVGDIWMKIHHPNLPRPLEHFTFLIPESQWSQSVSSVTQFTYIIDSKTKNSFCVVINNTVPPVRIRFQRMSSEARVWRTLSLKATKLTVWGMSLLVSSPESYLYYAFASIIQSIVNTGSVTLLALYDSFNILKSVDTVALEDLAIHAKTQAELKLTLKYLNQFIPVYEKFLFSKNLRLSEPNQDERTLLREVFEAKAFKNYQTAYRSLSILNFVGHPTLIWRYIQCLIAYKKAKHLFLKKRPHSAIWI